MIFPAVGGAVVIAIILWEAFETIILPRRVTRRLRFTTLFYRSTWRPWRAIARMVRKTGSRETFLSFYGPLSILVLFMVWAALLIVGFGLLDFSASMRSRSPLPFSTSVYVSGTTFFTLGLGDITPVDRAERVLAVIESGLGFGFLALVLSYLPVIYQAFSRREVNIVLLDARAGSPPTAAELLRRHDGPQGHESLTILLEAWERAAADILESHVSYPAVSYFRSQHSNESWLAALASILDTCALLISHAEDSCSRQARLTFAICRHTVVDLAQVFHAVPRESPMDRLPEADLQRVRLLVAKGASFSPSASLAKLTELRQMYEPYLQGLATHLYVELPPWILAKEITDNWRTSAWGRIAGFTDAPAHPNSPLDDHLD